MRKRGLPVVVGNEAPRLERDRGGDMEDVEGPGTEHGRMLRTQLGGEIERAAPEDIDDGEPSVANVRIEIGDRRSRETLIDLPAVDREVDGVDQLGRPKRVTGRQPPSRRLQAQKRAERSSCT